MLILGLHVQGIFIIYRPNNIKNNNYYYWSLLNQYTVGIVFDTFIV